MRRRLAVPALAGLASTTLILATTSAGAAAEPSPDPSTLGRIEHVVVIYEENHSFDNLYGGWGKVNGQWVQGVGSRGYAAHATQIGQDGKPLPCLPQNDVNLTSPPLDTAACDSVPLPGNKPPAPASVGSHFENRPFLIDAYIKPTDTTCPPSNVFAPNGVPKGTGEPGGCTRDLVHRFYNEQFQIHGGAMDRYTLGSDAMGLTQGRYATKSLPVYDYLHRRGAPKYVVADHWFQGAFGGSFLNHQYLISARAPIWANPDPAKVPHSVLDANGMPAATPLYPNTVGQDKVLTQACGQPTTVAGYACGDFAVNTAQPFSQPYNPSATDPATRLPLIDDSKYPNIGDELSAKGVSWNWFSGGWDNAAGNVGGRGWTNGSTPGTCTDPDTKAGATYPYCPGNLFQFHHQPFNYFANYAEGGPGRSHLKDEADFLHAARTGSLPAVSFVKPSGEENEHPGYASTENGESHLVDLLKAIDESPDADSTLVVVTYDEFGGQWDHVPPPGQGNSNGPHDEFGPGTRIPALLVGRPLKRSTVDHTSYDTSSILRTLEKAYFLAPLDRVYWRDANVNDLSAALRQAGVRLG